MLKADVNAQADMQQKIAAKNEGHQQGSAKKQKPTRHIRARAKIGADGDNYTLPPWIDQENFKTMVLMILKSVSNSQQRLRILESVIADNFMVPSDLAAVAAARAQAEAYHKKSLSLTLVKTLVPQAHKSFMPSVKNLGKLMLVWIPREHSKNTF